MSSQVANECLRVADIAARLGVSRASAYRIVRLMEHLVLPGTRIVVTTEGALASFLEKAKHASEDGPCLTCEEKAAQRATKRPRSKQRKGSKEEGKRG